MASSPSYRPIAAFGFAMLCIAGATYLFWPNDRSSLGGEETTKRQEELRSEATIDDAAPDRKLVEQRAEVEQTKAGAPVAASEEVEEGTPLEDHLRGIVYLPSGQLAGAGIQVQARVGRASFAQPSAHFGVDFGPESEVSSGLTSTKEDGTFEFQQISRTSAWTIRAGGDFMLSAERSKRDFQDVDGLIPLQLCEVVGGRVEIVDQFGDSLLEKTSIGAAIHTMPDRHSWSCLDTDQSVLALLSGSTSGLDELEGTLYRALSPELESLKVRCGSSWPGYEVASQDFVFDTVRNGVETHQLVLRDTGVTRGDIRFSLKGLPVAGADHSNARFEIAFYGNRGMYTVASEPDLASASLRGIPLGTYGYAIDFDGHQIARKDIAGEVEVAGPMAEVEIDVSQRGSLVYHVIVEGQDFKSAPIDIEIIDMNRGRVTDFLYSTEARLLLVPAGRYKLRTAQSYSAQGLEPVEKEFEIRAGETTDLKFVLPEAYREALKQ